MLEADICRPDFDFTGVERLKHGPALKRIWNEHQRCANKWRIQKWQNPERAAQVVTPFQGSFYDGRTTQGVALGWLVAGPLALNAASVAKCLPFIDFIERRLKSDPVARKILAMEESRWLARNWPVVKRGTSGTTGLPDGTDCDPAGA